MKDKNLLLICTAGITTGLLVRGIEQKIEENGIVLHVYSAPAIIAEQIINTQQVDGILIGPQAKYEVKRLEELLNFKNIPYRLIDQKNYERLNAKAVLEEGLEILDLKQTII